MLFVLPKADVERTIAAGAAAGARLELVGHIDAQPGIRIVTDAGTLQFEPSTTWSRA
jgi:hypothetical protein